MNVKHFGFEKVLANIWCFGFESVIAKRQQTLLDDLKSEIKIDVVIWPKISFFKQTQIRLVIFVALRL